MTQRHIDPAAAIWVVQALGRLANTVAILVGIAILAGGETHFSGPTYSAAMTYPGAPESWALFIFVAGCIGLGGSLSGRLIAVRLSLLASAVWAIFFAISITQSVLESPAAGSTGPAIYAHFALVCIVLAMAHKRLD